MTNDPTAHPGDGDAGHDTSGFAVPQGYVLMPLSITPAMREAAMAILTDGSNSHVLDDGAVSVETALPRLLLKAMVDARPAIPTDIPDADPDAIEGLRRAIALIDCFGNEPGDRATVLLERRDNSTFEMIDGRTNDPLTLAVLRRIAGSPGKGGTADPYKQRGDMTCN